MEGRKAKHLALKKLSKNTTFQRRWPEIFQHEFVMLIWLPEQVFQLNTYNTMLFTFQPGYLKILDTVTVILKKQTLQKASVLNVVSH